MEASLNSLPPPQFFLDCKDGKGVEKSLLVPINISYESLLNLLHCEYGRPVSFVYESQGLCTVDDDASFRTCINHVRSNFQKGDVSTVSRLDAFILELDQIPRKSRTLKVENNDARDKDVPSFLGHHPRRPTEGETRFDWSSSKRVGAMKRQTSIVTSGIRDVTKSASSIPGHRPRIAVPGQTARMSWDFEARFRQIDALMGQGPIEAERNLQEKKTVLCSTKTAANMERANATDLQAVDAAEAQVPGSHTFYPKTRDYRLGTTAQVLRA